jgi:peptidoglycan/LPS O-acetylase OafA/YrhL
LAVEEHFYLLLPLFLWILTRKKGTGALSAVPWTSAFLSLFFLLQRFIFASSTHLDRRIPMDALFLGVNLAYLQAYRPHVLQSLTKYRVPLLALAAVLLMPSFLIRGTLQLTLGLTAVYVAYAIVVVCFVSLKPGSWMDWRATRLLAFIGTYSYSIYLWHRDTSWEAYELALWLGNRLGLPHELSWLLYTSAYIAAGMAGGMVLGWLIETPVQRLRETLFPPRVNDRARAVSVGRHEMQQGVVSPSTGP